MNPDWKSCCLLCLRYFTDECYDIFVSLRQGNCPECCQPVHALVEPAVLEREHYDVHGGIIPMLRALSGANISLHAYGNGVSPAEWRHLRTARGITLILGPKSVCVFVIPPPESLRIRIPRQAGFGPEEASRLDAGFVTDEGVFEVECADSSAAAKMLRILLYRNRPARYSKRSPPATPKM